MATKPAWLPALISVNGSPEEIFARLYEIFETDFKQTRLSLEAKPVRWDTRILEGKYEEGFWHLITKQDRDTQERLLDSRRAERISWCAPSIKNFKDQAIKAWDYEESKKRIRTYLWLEEFDYVVILEQREQRGQEIVFLITAFHVDGESTRRGLRRKYENRLGERQPPLFKGGG